MRIVSLLLLTLFIATGCCSQKKADMKSTQIEYSAMSRGYYKSIVVKNKSVSVFKERNAEAVKSNIDDAKWNKIL
jgi:lipopolysaccharide biosynthesis regulator YciM